MEETIRLQDFMKALKKRIWFIISLVALGVIIAGVVSYFLITPVYQASTQILVNKTDNSEQQPFNSQEIQTNLQLINTYNVIIKSPAILGKVIEQLDLETTPASLTEKITVASAENSQVVNITAQDTDYNQAVDIANTTASVFQDEVKRLMNMDNVNILSQAELIENPSPVKPNPILNMVIGAIIGLMIGVGVAFLMEYFDTTIKNEQDVEDILGLPILGLISPFSNSKPLVQSRRRK